MAQANPDNLVFRADLGGVIVEPGQVGKLGGALFQRRYQQVVLESFGQVADALDALAHDAELVAAQSTALATATSNLDLARESYSAGNSGILEVIDAQRRRLDAQRGLLRAEARQYLDTAQFFLALGSGSSPLEGASLG